VRIFGLNLALAVLWVALMDKVTLPDLATGFIVAYLVLWLVRPALGETAYFRKFPQAAGFVAFFLKELIFANLRVAAEVLSPRPQRRPGVVAVPLEVSTPAEITFLANVVTLTPGTLSLDVSPDRKTLYVHGMFVDDPEAVRRDIKNGFERRILELLR
jgi:multicomponent Na+:H+ antiporter subunit E